MTPADRELVDVLRGLLAVVDDKKETRERRQDAGAQWLKVRCALLGGNPDATHHDPEVSAFLEKHSDHVFDVWYAAIVLKDPDAEDAEWKEQRARRREQRARQGKGR